LGDGGITVYEAVAVTGAACAIAYGTLARRLDLRAYGDVTGIAILAAVIGLAGWVEGDYWQASGIALAPLMYAVWQRLFPSQVFKDFQWFAHAASYLAWQALAQQSLRTWIGEAAAILAATAASGPLGVNGGHFLLPMAVALPLIALQRKPELLGVVARLYRPHPAHLHAAV